MKKNIRRGLALLCILAVVFGSLATVSADTQGADEPAQEELYLADRADTDQDDAGQIKADQADTDPADSDQTDEGRAEADQDDLFEVVEPDETEVLLPEEQPDLFETIDPGEETEEQELQVAAEGLIESAAKQDQSLVLSIGYATIAIGKSTTVAAVGAQGALSYQSLDTGIATVSSTGKVTGKSVGSVKIRVTAAATAEYKKTSATITVKVAPPKTSSLTAKNLAGGIKLTWKKVDSATGYQIWRNDVKIRTLNNQNTVNFTDTGATQNGKKYVYKVVAFAKSGTKTYVSPASASVTQYFMKAPSFQSFWVTPAHYIGVKWTKNSQATGYEIKIEVIEDGKYVDYRIITVKGADTVKRALKELEACRYYNPCVRAFKTVGSKKHYSAWSEPVCIENAAVGKKASWSYNLKYQSVTIAGSGTITNNEAGRTDCGCGCAWPDEKKIIISKGITAIGKCAFQSCNAQTVTLPKGMTRLGDCAFCSCGNLRTITIPKSVTEFGKDVFKNCPKVRIKGYAGSAAEKYAKKNKIPFIKI